MTGEHPEGLPPPYSDGDALADATVSSCAISRDSGTWKFLSITLGRASPIRLSRQAFLLASLPVTPLVTDCIPIYLINSNLMLLESKWPHANLKICETIEWGAMAICQCNLINRGKWRAGAWCNFLHSCQLCHLPGGGGEGLMPSSEDHGG